MQLPPLVFGTLLQRYKRFLCDVQLANNSIITAHCPNSGSMLGLNQPGSLVALSHSENPKRKYAHTLELVQAQGNWVGVHTGRTNKIVEEGIATGKVESLQGYNQLRREVRYGSQGSRIDLLLQDHPHQPDCYVEVKSVTLAVGRQGRFPDAVTKRGQKHLQELQEMAAQGQRAVLLFLVQRMGVDSFHPADEIDPQYGQLLREAQQSGVEVLAYGTCISTTAINLTRPISLAWSK
ncbi:DNA/RNA nuclease SfsA [Desulfurispira natronophila]|uniref:Sugar fermentation stimulation protein homolog n=1 Tax=Desulfurispira natronophila TaxID=682562 RepID=A0A7W8DG62_9BACT|nr:DNA/RNA nuclease SfsA [Desulfurispira natronophila]MBB5021092.1 sugar fermentation stimulation protein A [Desulfurispira natronophila]